MKRTLNHRIKRNIKHNLSFYISATLLTLISVYLMIAMYSAVLMLQKDFDDIAVRGNVEEAQFTTLRPISEQDQETLEKDYDVDIETIHYVDVDKADYSLRVFQQTKEINQVIVLEGEAIQSSHQILMNPDFMIQHSLKFGDTIEINGEEYNICGKGVRPDYLFAKKALPDFYVDKALFGQVTMSEEDFAHLDNVQSYYTIIYHKENDVEFRKQINETYFTMSYLNAKQNDRIELARGFTDEMMIMIDMIMPVFFAVIVIIVAVVIGRMVKREKKQIGTLIAFGYRKKELILHYGLYAAIPGVLGSLIGVILVLPTFDKIAALFATDYETITFHPVIHIPTLIIAIVLPTLLYLLTGMLASARMVGKNVVTLLLGIEERSKTRGRKLFMKSKMSFRSKYRIRSLIQNKSRTFVVFLGMFAGSFMCLLGFMFIDSCDRMMTKGIDAAGTYEYQYQLNTFKNDTLDLGEPMVAMNFEVDGGESSISVCGIENQPKYLNLKMLNHTTFDPNEFYITRNASILFDLDQGDTITLIHPLTMEKMERTICDIIDDNVQCAMYSGINQIDEILGLPDGSYNMILSDQELKVDPDIVAFSMVKENMKEQLRFSINLLYVAMYLFIAFGIVLSIISVYITVNMLIQENTNNISMLKVLGYRKNEINQMVLYTNHIILPIAFLASVLVSIKFCEIMFQKYINELNIYIQPVIYFRNILLGLAILVASYSLSLFFLNKKAVKVDMVESLKDNRE